MLSVGLLQGQHYVLVGSVVHIHVRQENDPGQMISLAERPGLAGACLHAVLAGNHNDRRVSRAGGLLDLSCEIRRPRRV